MLSAITQPNYPKAAIGFEKDSITALALQKEGRGQYGIRQAATIDLPANLLTPSFLETNISSPRELSVLIEEALEGSGLLNQKRWSVSLPSNTARTAIFTLENEPSSKQETEEILDWKAEQIFGAPAGELRISRQKIAPDREGKPRYFASAIKLAVIDEYETDLRRVRVEGRDDHAAGRKRSKLAGGPSRPDRLFIDKLAKRWFYGAAPARRRAHRGQKRDLR